MLPIEAREDIVAWRLTPTNMGTCRRGSAVPLFNVTFSFRTSLEPLAVTIGRDERGRAVACT